MAGDAGDATQDGGGQAAAQGDGAAAAAPDLAQVLERLESVGSSQEEMRQILQGQQWQHDAAEEGEQAPAVPEPDYSFMDQADEMPPEQFQQHLTSLIQQQAEAIADQKLGPILETQKEEKMQREASALVQEFPAFADPDTANKVFNTAKTMAEAQFSPEVAKELVQSPAWWRTTFLAMGGMDAHKQEGGAGASPAGHMEGGGGATPPPTQQDLAAQIVGASKGGSSVLPFR